MSDFLFRGITVEEGLRSKSSTVRAHFAEQVLYPTSEQIEKGLREKSAQVVRAWLSNPHIRLSHARMKMILMDDKARSYGNAYDLTDVILSRAEFIPDQELIEFGIRSLWSFSQRHWSKCMKYTLTEANIALICEVVTSDQLSQWIARDDFIPNENQMESLFLRDDYTAFSSTFIHRDNIIILDHIADLIKSQHRLELRSMGDIVTEDMIMRELECFDDSRLEAYRQQAIMQSITLHNGSGDHHRKRPSI